jgi:GNAT superfamily N-acetyltransferase
VIPKSGNRVSVKITREKGVIEVQRCADVSRAGEIHAFTQAIFGALDIDPPSSVLKESEADFAARLRDETCFVVEEGGKLIASMFCAIDGDALYVGRLAVAPEYRRRGVTNALMDTAKSEARRLGLKRITLGARITLARQRRAVPRPRLCGPARDLPSRLFAADLLRHGIGSRHLICRKSRPERSANICHSHRRPRRGDDARETQH